MSQTQVSMYCQQPFRVNQNATRLNKTPPEKQLSTGIATDYCSPETRHTVVSGPTHADIPIPLHQDELDDSPHIVGPAVTSDSHVLADYLSTVRHGSRSTPMVRPMLGGDAEPVIFTRVQPRPLGMTVDPTPPSLQLQMLEKLLEPWTDRLVDLYLSKANVCFPLLDEDSFRDQYRSARDRISPAVLACLYANSLTYWKFDPTLSPERCPDQRFAWNLACQVLYSELRHSPGISSIAASLLNVGGRPTTSMLGNGVQLGAAISLSHSLGLNRNPLPWHIPQSEKFLRMKIWWCLLIHDRWSSLAYGTPPRLRSDQSDVPLPTVEYLSANGQTSTKTQASAVFVALVGLTQLLEVFLDNVYRIKLSPSDLPVDDLEARLGHWVDTLKGDTRKVILRGTHLDSPGASNLRLAYLSTKLLLRRIELNHDKQAADAQAPKIDRRYSEVRHTAEEIVSLVQELEDTQLGDFWLPVAAFTFSHTVTFLIRCALETEDDPLSLSQSPSLHLAKELLDALRQHQDRHGWDLADISLAQHTEVVDKLLTPDPADDVLPSTFLETQQQLMPEFPFMEDMFSYTNLDFLQS
ncbi:uncharacterized protein VDAG_05672 [Verticillium dahliae VdLs.17]|uniref:Xylanolytic transcriptional activator regulatory domain-containing protein n=2 Tax=Verticillium dahliae TaxID=27337 RepID=G2X690_VERDV|nr:uncharacterized protein VDAG_05672 [Verticillium dahliae VdLs.17]EGY14508.1 hypothetical protein VDAG_05672 [Verticillium dahliae VdLs.17]